jgi:plastocyanin
MGTRNKGGLVGGFDQLRAPDAPTITSTSAGDASLEIAFTAPSDVGGGTITGYIAFATNVPQEPVLYTVTVQDVSGNKYFIDSSQQATLTLVKGHTYTFDWSAATSHPLRFSTTSDGTHNSGSEYTTGVVKDDSAYTTKITVDAGAPSVLYYYCQNHSGMGGSANVQAYVHSSATGTSSPITVGSLSNDISTTSYLAAQNVFGVSPNAVGSSGTPTGSLAMFFGGYNGSANLNNIQQLDLTSSSNATDFGDIGSDRSYRAAVGTPTRCVAGGFDSTSGEVQLEYVNPASAGNSQDFGLLARVNTGTGSFNNSTYGIFAPRNSGSTYDFMRITIASLGNTSDVGDLSLEIYNFGGGISNGTIGLVFGGYNSQASGTSNAISQKNITSSGASTDFGDMSSPKTYPTGASNSTRGVIGGGNNSGAINVIEYVTIASAGNATDFGDLTSVKDAPSGAASSTKAVFAGGLSGSALNTIDVVTIASAANSTDFGDLIAVMYGVAGTGTRHGGIS